MEEDIPDTEFLSLQRKMSRPVPGEGLLSNPETPWPWENPPKFSSVLKASEYMFSEFTSDELYPILLDAMDEEIPIMDITRFILFKGFTEGLWTPDLLILLIEPTSYILLALAERALIDPIVYREEDEDDISEEVELLGNTEALAELRNYTPEQGIPEGALSKNITSKLEALPKGRSLLEKPSLLERTG